MASTIQVGVLRGVLSADTAQWTMGLRNAEASLRSFEGQTKRHADGIVRGMSAAGRAATDSSRMIAGMGASGREALGQSEQILDRTAQAGNRAGQALTAVAGIIGTINIGQKAAQAAEATSRIQDAAERLKVGTEAVQRLAFAAEQSGGSLEGVAVAMGRMAETLGSAKAAERLKAIGLSLDQIKGLTPDQTFIVIAEAIRKIPDPLRQSDEATNLFGRSALQLLPAIRAGFKDVGDQAPVMSDALIQSGDRVGDKLREIEIRMNNLKAQALLPLVDVFTRVLPESIQVAVLGFTSFLPSLEQVALGVIALGGPSGAWAALVAMGTTVAAFFTTTLPAAFSTTLAFLGPVGWIALALVALVGVWFKWGDDIKAFLAPLMDWIGERFGMLRQHAIDTWTGIVDTAKSFLASLGAILKRIPTELLLPLLGPIGLVLVAFQKWPEIARIAERVYTAVKTWLVDKFAQVVKWIGEKVNQVTGFFRDMYTAVVGQSYVPDMIREIGSEFGRLDDVMVSPARLGVSLVQDAFQGMRRAVVDVVHDMLETVSSALTGWLDGFMPSWAAKLVGGVAASVLGGLGGALTGGGGGGGILGGLLGRGGGGVLAGLMGGGANASVAGVLAGNAGIAGVGGGAAAGGGGLAGLGALMTNPWTIGIAAAALGGLALWKTGFGRGGWEGTEGNKRRDKFIAQWGPAGTGPGSGFANLAAFLAGKDSSGSLFQNLLSGDKQRFESAQQAIASLAGMSGKRIQTFALGGMVRGLGAQLAMVHGGEGVLSSMGVQNLGGPDMVEAMNSGQGQGPSVISLNFSIQAWDSVDVTRAIRTQVIPELKQALMLNTGGFGAAVAGVS
jgi:hypothetical protein